MRLKCIKLAGFKSFVDPTTVGFPSNLCAVVGPNGCGKSNIIDAVRWVMGESSAKNLRGESMTDVIFNGSGGRKPVGQASIELVFDNSDGSVTGEYASYAEIAVRRKVTRDGQNNYYLNGSKCRRRDITDIFLGTGLGPRSYAIIEQGMISRLIEAKPEELRVYVEEAAGISKYKERRRDTENRMRRTQENLERLTDIREELERQLARLERQAQAAEKYTALKKDERLLKAQVQALRYQTLQAGAEEKHALISELELKVESAVTDQVHQDAAIEKHRNEYTELGDAFNEVQGRYYAVGADIARIEQSIQHARERERQLQTDLEQTRRDCTEAEEHMAADRHKTEGWQAELLEIEPELALLGEAEEDSSEVLLQAEEAMQEWQQAWDQFNQRAAEPRQQAEVQQSRIKHMEQVQQRLLERIERFENERKSLVVGEVEDEINSLDEDMATLDLQAEEKRAQAEEAAEALETARNREQQLARELDTLRSQLQTSRGRHASLEALQQAALGQNKGKITEWLADNKLDGQPRLAEQLTVTDGWNKAVETVLGHSLQAICVEQGFDAVADLFAGLEQGELTLLDSALPPVQKSNDKADTLLSKVSSAVSVDGLLTGVYAAETLHDALTLRASLAPGETVVTRDGLWLGTNWLRVARDKDASAGVIARKQELEELTQAIASLEERAEALAEQLATCKSAVENNERQRETLRREAEQLTLKHSEARSQVNAHKTKVEQVLEGRQRVERDINDARQQMDAEASNLTEARQQLHAAIATMEKDTEERERLLSQRDAIRADLDNARQRARHDKDRHHQLAMRHQSVKTQLGAVQQGIQRLQDQLQRMQERREQLTQTLEETREPVEENKLELEASLEKRVSVENELSDARRRVEEVEAALREAERLRHQAEQILTGLRGNLEKERLEAQTLDVKSAGLQQQLQEENFELEQVIEGMPEGLEIAELEQELERMAGRIARLGAINLAAIDEYKTEAERKQYLDAQHEDLQEALETLENAIKKIDRETRTRFKETFDKINAGLQELFPKVFGGGHAYLELTGEDLLDTGIAIMARPPGKRNSTIHLLSGGEKALTAIALVFSIFRLNPAPFCMLDEVDAPLDDANVGRYARLVEEMSAQVQFIYITHNKIAMEMAHQLMGVTMHEPGVSRMVTVDVDEATELAAV